MHETPAVNIPKSAFSREYISSKDTFDPNRFQDSMYLLISSWHERKRQPMRFEAPASSFQAGDFVGNNVTLRAAAINAAISSTGKSSGRSSWCSILNTTAEA